MKAIIFKPAKNVMQSGRGKSGLWVLECDQGVIRKPERLNGWTSANCTAGQIRVRFDSLDQAVNFAESNDIAYYVKPSSQRKVRPRNFMDNYKYVPFEGSEK